jgi:hypothetical protein
MTFEWWRLTISSRGVNDVFATLATTIFRISNSKVVMFTPLVLRLSIATRSNARRRGCVNWEKRCWCRGCVRGSHLHWSHRRGRCSWRQWWVGHTLLHRLLWCRFLQFGDRGRRGKEKWRVRNGTRTGAGRYLEMEHEQASVYVLARRSKRHQFIMSHSCLDQCANQDNIRDVSVTTNYFSLLRKFH